MLKAYRISCPCGADETFQDHRTVENGRVECEECGEMCLIDPVNPVRSVGFWPTDPKTLGNMSQKFESQKEMDAFCEKRGYFIAPPGSPARKQFDYDTQEAANSTAKEAGYRDLDHMLHATKAEKRERRAANREAVSADRVKKFGSEHKAHADDASKWGGTALHDTGKIVSKPRKA